MPLISYSKEGGNSLQGWKHQVLGPSQLRAGAWGGFAVPGGGGGAGAVMAVQGDAAKLRTPTPGSAESQPSSSAYRLQRLAWCSCSWAAGRVFSTPRQAKGFAHLAPKYTWVLQMLGCIPVGAHIPWTFLQLIVASKTPGTGQHPWRCGAEPGSLQPAEQQGLPARSAVGGWGARAAGCPRHTQGGAGRQVGICREAFSAWRWARPWQVHLQFN